MGKRKTCSGVNRVFLLILFNMTVVPLVLGRLFAQMDIYGGTVVTVCLYMLPILLYAAVTQGNCLRDIQFAVPRLSIVLAVLLFSVLLLPVVTWINMFSMMFSRNHIAEELLSMEQQSFWKNVLFAALIPAAAEELAVRGVLYHGYRRAGILKAAVVSGVLFGIMHLNINQFCYAAVLGTVFALLVEASGNLFYSMEAHFVINLNSVLLMNAEASASQDAVQETAAGSDLLFLWTFYSVLSVICIILARAVFFWIARRSRRWEHMQAVFCGKAQEGVDGKYRVLTPALVTAVLFGFAYMILTERLLA